MKTAELTGAALDWAVAKCEKPDVTASIVLGSRPSTDWAQGGPIIEREEICLMHIIHGFKGPIVYARIGGAESMEGPTPLIAAMRCYVASKLGDEIEIPKELTE
jgi:Protein of unknown function (DUF2591)